MSTTPTTPTIYTPPNWATQKALYSITFASQGTTTYKGLDADGNAIFSSPTTNSANGYNPATGITMFVFDAIRRAGHRLYSVPTQHPLQTGFNISDHVVLQPAQVVLEVSMQDSIASYSNGPGLSMWGSNPSKAVAAFQQMEALMKNRQLVTLNTRLETYSNMLLVSIESEDTHRTYFGGLHMVLTFQQLFIADVALQYDSARVETTGQTDLGTVQSEVPDPTTVAQHQVTQASYDALANRVLATTEGAEVPATLPTVPGAGTFSSTMNWIANLVPGATMAH